MIETTEPRARAGIRRVAALLVAAASAAGPAPAAGPGADGRPLAAREAELLQRYRELEGAFLRLADALDASDPTRAAALRAAFERGRELRVGDRIAAIVEQLEQGQLLKAGTGQLDALEQFRALLELVEAGGSGDRLGDTKKKLRDLIGRVAKVTARQRDVEGATEAGAETGALAERQEELAGEAERLAEEVEALHRDSRQATSAPSAPPGPDDESPAVDPPAGPADEPAEADAGDDVARSRRTAARLRAAERRMEAAREKLDRSLRQDARDEQMRAVAELETARAELEEILRQVREQEVERTLVQLEARLRAMLKAERGVLADAERIARSGGSDAARERQLEAARLGREQERIGVDAAKAVALVRDDGSAVAIPQALDQIRDDVALAAARLGRADLGRETIGLLGDIVVGLEEMLAAVEQAHRNPDDRASAAAAGGGGEAGEQPLVSALAELKMLRTLQVRVNARTQRLGRLLDDGAAAGAEVREVLGRLAERQRAIERAAREIVKGVDE
ncbi:MAG: hypothetical protein FJ286_06705 [Planctomycetes bacterium]|nr:hypothetical protein [Planctomycetota bacterium]